MPENTDVGEAWTALMRMQYMDRIDILRWFIRSVRAGNWLMQVWTMKEMPPNLLGGE